MRPALLRLRTTWTLVLVAWFAQLCLPVAHAAMASSSHAGMAAWCGDPANAREAAALLPAEIRDALALDDADASHLAHCAQLCAVGTTPALLPAPPAQASLPPASAVPLPLARPSLVVVRRHALPPPSHAPPAGA